MAAKKKATMAKKERAKTVCVQGAKNCGSGGCAYFLGFLGAAIYYLWTATGFWNGVLGLLKAAVWPLFLVHGLLKFIGA